jgi:peptidoglycan/xylan/chitin deacetylase (PgdA/CDA1 family)
MVGSVQNFVRLTDAAVARMYLSMFQERGALMCFMFHSLFRNQLEIDANVVDPLQRTTIAQLRQFIRYYLDSGYTFLSPQDLLDGELDKDGRYAMMTFDDGYFNNMLAVPILEEFRVPATFFISTNHIKQNKSYWWDVLYRELIVRGFTNAQIQHEALTFKAMKHEAVDDELVGRFGAAALTPRGDIDRPFTPDELAKFASCPYVHLGNHTTDHAILINYSADEMRQQVVGGQDALEEMTGRRPISIAYPNGGHDGVAVQICREAGLPIGFTIRPEKNDLPLDNDSPKLSRLGRFCPHGEEPMLRQCHTFRSDYQIYGTFRDMYLKLARGKSNQ